CKGNGWTFGVAGAAAGGDAIEEGATAGTSSGLSACRSARACSSASKILLIVLLSSYAPRQRVRCCCQLPPVGGMLPYSARPASDGVSGKRGNTTSCPGASTLMLRMWGLAS